MAGSKRPSIYITDIPNAAGDGNKIIVINGDESNAEATGGVAATPSNLASREFASEGGDYIRLEPRYILLQGQTSGGRIVRRKIVAYDPENTLFVDGGTLSLGVMTGADTVEAVTFSVSGMVGEKRTVVPGLLDTGLNDGDVV